MSLAALQRRRSVQAAWATRIAVGAVVLLGVGAAFGFAAALASNLPLGIAAGALVAGGLLVLLAAGWLDALQLLVFCLPLPALYSSDAARIAPPLLVSALILVAWVFMQGTAARAIPWQAIPLRSALLLLFATACATGFAQHPLVAARELVNWIILLGFLLVATAELAGVPKRVHSLALTIAGVAGVCGALAALEMLGVLPARFARPTSALNRAALGFGWPNELGMFMALALPFSVYACSTVRGVTLRRLARAGLIASIVGLVATFSRGSWLAVLMASLLLLFVGQGRFVLRVWIAALAAAILLDVLTSGAIRDRIASTIGDWVVEQRAALMLAGVLMFQAHPIAGVGPGGFAESLQEFGPGITWLWDYLPTAQNAYVQMAAETGVIGLAALLIFLCSTLRVLLRATRGAAGNAGDLAARGAPGPAGDRADDHTENAAARSRLQLNLRTTGDLPVPGDEIRLRRTLLWSFGVACALCLVEWTFAHGIGQLIMLVAAMGFALTETRPAR